MKTMKKSWKKFLAAGLIFFTVLSLTGCGAADAGGAAESELFTAMQTEDVAGNAVDSTVFAENELTLVNVWNVGCSPCIWEIPTLDRLNQEYAEKGVAIKGLVYEFSAGLSDTSRAEVEEILNDADATYQQLLASEEMCEQPELKKLDSFPTTFFVDKNGTIVKTLVGAREYEDWKAEIEAVLQGMTNA